MPPGIPGIPGFPTPFDPNVAQTCLSNLLGCPQVVLNSIPSGEIVQACVQRLQNCPEEIIKRLPAEAARPILMQYIGFLQQQASGHYKRLPDWFMDYFAADYEINLRDVRFAEGINTIHGQAITIGNRVYTPDSFDFYSRNDLSTVLHELQHVVQYRRKGGQDAFLSEYLLHGAGEIIQKKSFNIHDEIDIEQDAIRQSAAMIARYGWALKAKNTCSEAITIIVRYRSEGTWQNLSWKIGPKRESWLNSSGGAPAHTNNRLLYYGAYNDSGDALVEGNHSINFGGETQNLEQVEYDSDADYFELDVNCN